jgi:hypothetical protein
MMDKNFAAARYDAEEILRKNPENMRGIRLLVDSSPRKDLNGELTKTSEFDRHWQSSSSSCCVPKSCSSELQETESPHTRSTAVPDCDWATAKFANARIAERLFVGRHAVI